MYKLSESMGGNAYFPSDILDKKLLVIGAGGIGCELLKNLAMAGFNNIEVIDLDTIDVSNLNRQFLFRREHVGMSKAQVAAEAVRAMRPEMNIVYKHGSIFDSEYNTLYFQNFAVVLNALDNLGARRHVNRLCVNGRVPLIDGGTTGFLGQVRVIKRDVTECFDCVEHPVPKTFPTCTIRNTPSEFIHCITWSKYLFNQLFGEHDPDTDVSPEENIDEQQNVAVGNTAQGETNVNEQAEATANVNEEGQAEVKEQTEAAANVNEEEGQAVANAEEAGEPANEQPQNAISTRQFAESNNYNPQELYNKLFVRDIEYLLRMESLWKDRRPPQPYYIDDITSIPQSSTEPALNVEWSLEKWISEFASSVQILSERFAKEASEGRVLVWDKDDDVALRFVGACSNIRAHIFDIKGRKSLFDVKAMAGNIIPAIATSNAIVAGLMVMETYKVIANRENEFKSSFIALKPTVRGKIVVNDAPVKPNPKCYVCPSKREVYVKLNTLLMTQKTFVSSVLKQGMGMIAPDASDLSSGRIIASSEQRHEDTEFSNTVLSELSVVNGTILDCDDFQQAFDLKLYILHDDKFDAENYEIARDSTSGKEQVAEPVVEAKPDEEMKPVEEAKPDEEMKPTEEANPVSDDGLVPGTSEEANRKRSADASDLEEAVTKRARVDEN